jgi:hypothetical protein
VQPPGVPVVPALTSSLSPPFPGRLDVAAGALFFWLVSFPS